MNIKEWVGIIISIGAASWAVYKKVLMPVLKSYRLKKAEYNSMLAMIKTMHSELQFNGGGSIKDGIWLVTNSVKEIEVRLSGIEEGQKIFMNLQGINYWTSDEAGECNYASPGLCKLIGRSEEEIKGVGWAAWIIPEDKDRVYNAWKFSVSNRSAFDEIYTFKKSDGTVQKVWGLAFHKKAGNVHIGTVGKLEPVKI